MGQKGLVRVGAHWPCLAAWCSRPCPGPTYIPVVVGCAWTCYYVCLGMWTVNGASLPSGM